MKKNKIFLVSFACLSLFKIANAISPMDIVAYLDLATQEWKSNKFSDAINTIKDDILPELQKLTKENSKDFFISRTINIVIQDCQQIIDLLKILEKKQDTNLTITLAKIIGKAQGMLTANAYYKK